MYSTGQLKATCTRGMFPKNSPNSPTVLNENIIPQMLDKWGFITQASSLVDLQQQKIVH